MRREFTAAGKIQRIDGKKRFVPAHTGYIFDQFTRFQVGEKVWAHYSNRRRTATENQRSYHFVLVGYIAEHTGYSKDETHDALIKGKWGTRRVKLGPIETEGRRSWTSLTNPEATEQIMYDLEITRQLDIVVPSKEELGYL